MSDPMPAGLVERALERVHAELGDLLPEGTHLELDRRPILGLRRHDCSVDGCDRDAVVFPPPTCAEHGGLDEVRP